MNMEIFFPKREETRIIKTRIKKMICAILIASLIVPGASLVGNAPGVYASSSGYHSAGCQVRVVQNNFSVPELDEYGKRYELFLDGELAFCLQRGAPARSNVEYSSMTYGTSYAINQALEYFYVYNSDRESYVLCQVYIWALMEGKNAALAMMQAAQSINSEYQGYEWDMINAIQSITPTKYYNIFESPTPGEQPIGWMVAGNYMENPQYATATASKSVTNKLSTKINVIKTDSITGEKLEGVGFDFFVDDVCIGTAQTNEEGMATMEYSQELTGEGTEGITYCSNYSELPYCRLSWVTTYTNYNDALNAANASALQKAQANAKAKVDSTPHTYTVRESSPRAGYCLPNAGVEATEELTGSGEVNFSFENETIKGSILITKTEKGKPDVYLEGAKFGVYAGEDIIHPDGVTGIVFSKDDLIEEVVTDENGKAVISDLFQGEYYVKELMPPNGYQKNDKVFLVDVKTESVEEPEFECEVLVEDEKTPIVVAPPPEIIESHVDAYVPDVSTGDTSSFQFKNLALIMAFSFLVSVYCIRQKKRYN